MLIVPPTSFLGHFVSFGYVLTCENNFYYLINLVLAQLAELIV